MARKLKVWVGLLALISCGPWLANAQTPAESTRPSETTKETTNNSAPPRRPGFSPGGGGGSGGGERHRPNYGSEDQEKFQNVRRALDALTPEQRKRFQENFQRWSNFSPEDKKALSDRESFRHRKMAEDIEQAIKSTNLELAPEQRALFVKRYTEERHQIEEQIRKDSDEKRQPLLAEMLAKLKSEFTQAAQIPKR